MDEQMKPIKLSPEGVRHAARCAQHVLSSVYEHSPRYKDAILLLYMCEEILGEKLVSQKDFDRFPPSLFKNLLAWKTYPKGGKRPSDPLTDYGIREKTHFHNPWATSASTPRKPFIPPRPPEKH